MSSRNSYPFGHVGVLIRTVDVNDRVTGSGYFSGLDPERSKPVSVERIAVEVVQALGPDRVHTVGGTVRR